MITQRARRSEEVTAAEPRPKREGDGTVFTVALYHNLFQPL